MSNEEKAIIVTELNAAMLSVLSTHTGQSRPVILRIIAVISIPASVFSDRDKVE